MLSPLPICPLHSSLHRPVIVGGVNGGAEIDILYVLPPDKGQWTVTDPVDSSSGTWTVSRILNPLLSGVEVVYI